MHIKQISTPYVVEHTGLIIYLFIYFFLMKIFYKSFRYVPFT